MNEPVAGMLTVGRLVRRIMTLEKSFAARETALLEPHGLTPAQRDALVVLKSQGPLTLSGLARARGFSRQNARTLVRALEAGGHVDMQPNPEHKKAPLAVISDRGKDALQAVMHAEGLALAELSARVEAAEARAALATLEKLDS